MSPRYDWDFRFLDGFRQLLINYLDSEKFRDLLFRLYDEAPPEIKELKVDDLLGVVEDDGVLRVPSLAGLLFSPEARAQRMPGNENQMGNRYHDTWHVVLDRIGENSLWCGQVRDEARKWGLNARWGNGLFVEMVIDNHGRSMRSKGIKDIGTVPVQSMVWNIRALPDILTGTDALYPPYPRPDMSETEWEYEIERYRQEGGQALKVWHKELIGSDVWSGTWEKMELHVEWLFKRITPPYITPINLVEDYTNPTTGDFYSVRAIETANSKTARILGLRISPGVRGPRKTRDLPRSSR